jgi:hypothetical protein
MSIQCLHWREVLPVPDRRKNVPGGVKTVLGRGIVILEYASAWIHSAHSAEFRNDGVDLRYNPRR